MYHEANSGPWFSKSLGVMVGPFNKPDGGDCTGGDDEFNYFKVGNDSLGRNLLTGEVHGQFTVDEIEVYLVEI